MNELVNKMTSFIVMDVMEKASEMKMNGVNDIIHMEVGEPDFNMPKDVMKAAAEAVESGKTHYTHSLGDEELRIELSRFYKEEYGVDVEPDRFLITSGSSPAILIAVMMLSGYGKEVIVSNPGYSCYRNFVLASGAKPVEVPLSAEDGFQFDIETLRKTINKNTAAIMTNSPMNPTGTLMDVEIMRQMVKLGVPIISDEIYHGLVYGTERAHSILEYADETDDVFVVNGFSKRFAMTGMRLGYLIAPKKYMRVLQTLQQNLLICAPSVSQKAGIEALKNVYGEEVIRMRDTYDERRKFLIGRLREIGFRLATEPTGAFYVFADASMFTKDCYKFAFDILDKCHVGITPGIDFGTRGEGFVRFSYANSLENIKEAMNRLESILV